MSEIRTYNAHELIQAKKHREEIVLKADHLAVVEATHQRHEESMNQRISDIAALRAALAEKNAKVNHLIKDNEIAHNIVTALTARIKGLEGALEKIVDHYSLAEITSVAYCYRIAQAALGAKE